VVCKFTPISQSWEAPALADDRQKQKPVVLSRHLAAHVPAPDGGAAPSGFGQHGQSHRQGRERQAFAGGSVASLLPPQIALAPYSHIVCLQQIRAGHLGADGRKKALEEIDQGKEGKGQDTR
jgi:hypothetical protein